MDSTRDVLDYVFWRGVFCTQKELFYLLSAALTQKTQQMNNFSEPPIIGVQRHSLSSRLSTVSRTHIEQDLLAITGV